MNAVLSRRVSLIAAHGLPSIPSPTIGGATGDLPIASGSVPPRQASSFPSRLAHVHRPNRVHLVPVSRDLVTDWSFSFRCSPPRLAATQLRSDTPRLFAAEKRTLTVLSTHHLRRTRAIAAAPPKSPPDGQLRRTGNLSATPDMAPMTSGGAWKESSRLPSSPKRDADLFVTRLPREFREGVDSRGTN